MSFMLASLLTESCYRPPRGASTCGNPVVKDEDADVWMGERYRRFKDGEEGDVCRLQRARVSVLDAGACGRLARDVMNRHDSRNLHLLLQASKRRACAVSTCAID